MQSYRDPSARWLGSPNYWLDRDGHDMAIQPAWVVIHTMVGTIASANGRFQNPGEGASAHYGVGYHGDLVQWVDEKDAAWHAGDRLINLDSIGIEHEDMGLYDDPRPDALYATSSALVRRICLRYGIPIDRAHIRPHNEVSDSPTACPDALDLTRIIAAAAVGDDMTPDQDAKLTGLFNGWFTHDRKIDAIAAALDLDFSQLKAALPPPLDVDALAAALVAHLPAEADAQAVAKAVVAELADKLSTPTG